MQNKTYLDILNNLDFKSQKSLSDDKINWITNLIEKYKPNRILEIGVSTGGSTAVYLNCINKLNLNTEYVAVDICKNANNKHGKPIIANEVYELKEYLNLDKFKLYMGKYIPELINKIGSFDLIIFDTVHFIPGEILDVICLKNNIKENAILIFDDINIECRYPNLYSENLNSTSCNPILLSSIKGPLLLPNDDFPNIGAIIYKGFDNDKILLNLCHKWNTDLLDSKDIYFNCIKNLYNDIFYTRLINIYNKYKYSNFN